MIEPIWSPCFLSALNLFLLWGYPSQNILGFGKGPAEAAQGLDLPSETLTHTAPN